MIMRLNHRHTQWLSEASKDERTVWLSKGPAEVAELGSFEAGGKFIKRFRPAIRGVFMGTLCDSAQAASEQADTLLNDYIGEAAALGIRLDEDALGISTTNHEITDIMGDATLQIVSMTHLGCALAAGDGSIHHHYEDPISEFIEALMERPAVREALALQLPWLDKFVSRLESFSEDDKEDDSILHETFREMAWDGGARGFLISAAHPLMEFCRDSIGASYSWGRYQSAWFYGESLLEAVRSAAAFFEAQDAVKRANVCGVATVGEAQA